MKATILNKKVKQIYEFYNRILENSESTTSQKLEAFQAISIIQTVSSIYEQNADVFMGQLIIKQDWCSPDSLDNIVSLISNHMAKTG